ncbi:hypothetical protein ACTFIY_011130 [Dictyostelium cf. discoideum]
MIQIIKKPKDLKSLKGENLTMEVVSICWSDLKDSGHQNFVILTNYRFTIDSLLQDGITFDMGIQSRLKVKHKNEIKLCSELMNFTSDLYNDYDDGNGSDEDENIDYHLVRYERLNNEGKEDLLEIFKSDEVIYVKTEEERKKENVFLFNDTKVTPVKTKLKAYQKPIDPSETLVNATIQKTHCPYNLEPSFPQLFFDVPFGDSTHQINKRRMVERMKHYISPMVLKDGGSIIHNPIDSFSLILK